MPLPFGTYVNKHRVQFVNDTLRYALASDSESGLFSQPLTGRVAELADALDLGSSGEIRGGSSPSTPTFN